MDVSTVEPEVGNDKARDEFQLGRTAFAENDLEGAARHFQASLDADPNHLNAKLNLGLTFVKMKDDRRAEPIVRGVIEVSPRNGPAHGLLGRLLLRRGDLEAALAHLEITLAERPDDEDVLFLVARLMTDLARPADAAAIYRGLLDRNADNARASKALGFLEWALGNRVESVTLLQHAANHEPDNLKLRMALASYLLQIGRLTEAAAAFQLAANAEPENLEPLLGLGECALLAFDIETATTHFQSAAALAPGDLCVRKWVLRIDEIRDRWLKSSRAAVQADEGNWRGKLIEAAAILRNPEADRAKRNEAGPLLVSYGYTDAVPTSFGASGRVAHELDRMGLSRPCANLANADPDSEELNSLTGCVERLNIGADTLLLVFGGSNQNVFLSFDVLHRFLGSTGASVVYLRNVAYNMYSSIAGLAGDFAGTVEKLREIKERAGAKRILIFSYCLGGIGAFNYGLALGAEAIVCFRPFFSVPKIEDLPPALAERAALLRQANPLFRARINELDFGADGAPRATLIANADIEPAASICSEMAKKSAKVRLVAIKGGANSDSLVDATARGLLWPLLTSFINNGEVASDVLDALERGC